MGSCQIAMKQQEMRMTSVRNAPIRQAFRPLGVLDPLNLPCSHSHLPTCLFAIGLLAFQPFATGLLALYQSRAGPPWGPRLDKSSRSLGSMSPFGGALGQLSDFWSLYRGTKKTRFFGIAPKEQKSHNQWPKVTSGIILGSIFGDFGSHFNIDFSIIRIIDSALIFH